jgi:A/G-specific adenine glycosylase
VYFVFRESLNSKLKTKYSKLVLALLDWFAANARDLPWRRTRDPYAIWVSEIMLQQTQVKTVIPFWERWMRELPTIEAAANASSEKLHKLWEGLGYYTRVRNLQKAAQQIVEDGRRRGNESQNKIGNPQSAIGNQSETPHVVSCKYPERFEEVLALPGIGRYTAGAVCSIAFNQPTPILDGNVIRVLTRVFGIAENPKEKNTNALLWKIAGELVSHAKTQRGNENSFSYHAFAALREENPRTRTRAKGEDDWNCSHFNQSLMELGALICTPRNPQCGICPAKALCLALKENRVCELPNLGKREAATARRFMAFVIGRGGKYLVRQRPARGVNAHLWEFPNVEINSRECCAEDVFKAEYGVAAKTVVPLATVIHSITRYRITLEAFWVKLGGANSTSPHSKMAKSGTRGARPSEKDGAWITPEQMLSLPFASAHKKVLSKLVAAAG